MKSVIFPKFYGTVRVCEILCLLLGALLLPPCFGNKADSGKTESCNLLLQSSKPTERHQAEVATQPQSLAEESFYR